MNFKNEIILHLIEYSPIWENNRENLTYLSEIIKDINYSDIIILPEMFNTGFSNNVSKIAEKMDGKTVQWMIDISLENHVAICGSIAISEYDEHYNRFIFVADGKIVATYDKRHLFSFSGENIFYKPGNSKVTFIYLGWKICPMICYDLRFPVWNRNTENYDLLLNVANWPKKRIEAWDALLKARSIENLCYVCGVNRLGTDGNGLSYLGHSSIFTPEGKLLKGNKVNNFIYKQIISQEEIKRCRNIYHFLEDQDHFQFL
ncbi:nitrilase-related carbon-nitrogen hydrolase [uncultured Apibacter sp.]|uniref:nitrilase-related carbon-nitrogen hydrolase n=1 Tax=uncultured Apibacter sp. TaxID=1778616 RepID=UPI0025D2CB9C|nr:nitrilase-related carbon-nitrogen hydrolase [uncultured Apibacter sp.]